jgi:hypothetical protein
MGMDLCDAEINLLENNMQTSPGRTCTTPLEEDSRPLQSRIDKSSVDAEVTTTLMLRGIPNRTKFQYMGDAIKEQGFANDYDMVYMPTSRTMGTLRNLGYIFINFKNPKGAAGLLLVGRFASAKVWHLSIFGMRGE